jgi:hypothetical protein
MNNDEPISVDWRWCTAEGSRDLDRLLDRRLTFREKLEWLEEAETLTLQLRASREKQQKQAGPGCTGEVPGFASPSQPCR